MTKVIIDGISGDILKQYIERIEKLEEEKAELMGHIRDLYAAAKSDGLEPAIMKRVIKTRKMRQEDLEEQETLFDIYRKALGMET